MTLWVSWTQFLDFVTILGIPSLVLGVWALFAARTRLAIAFTSRSHRVVGSVGEFASSDLRMYLRDRPITSLFRTRIIIWNQGNKPLRNQDIAPADQLKIAINSDDILKIGIIKTSSPSNMCSITEHAASHSEYNISFDYLEPREGLIVELLHENEATNFELTGKIIGAQNSGIFDVRNNNNWLNGTLATVIPTTIFPNSPRFRWKILTIYILFVFFFLFFMPLFDIPKDEIEEISKIAAYSLITVLSFIWIILSISNFRAMMWDPPKDLVGPYFV